MALKRKFTALSAKLLSRAKRLNLFLKQQEQVEREIRNLRQASADENLSDKVVVITGSSKGIGFVLARAFAQRGAKVVINGRSQADLDLASENLRTQKLNAIAVCCDVSQQGGSEKLLAESLNAYGHVDILINNAAVTGPLDRNLWDIDLPDWYKTLDANLNGVFLCSRIFTKWMVDNDAAGRIINVSSGAADYPAPQMTPYATSKGALETLTHALAVDAKDTRIMVAGVQLGSTQSEMTKKYFPLETYLQLPPPEVHIPVFVYMATASPQLLHGRILASWRFKQYDEAEAWLASPLAGGERLNLPPRTVPPNLKSEDMVFLDLGESQIGTPPSVREFLINEASNFKPWAYPDVNYGALKQDLAATLNLSADNIALGNGSSELIERLLRLFIRNGESVVSNDPSWYMFDRMCATYGIPNYKAPFTYDATWKFNHNLKGILNAINVTTRLIYLIHPSNPIGVPLWHEEFVTFLKQVPKHIPVVVDEAYIEFADEENGLLRTMDIVKTFDHPVIGLRTFSKAYGLAGMRVGYAYSSPQMIKLLTKLELAFNIASIAAESARVALRDVEHLAKVRKNVTEEKQRIQAFLNSVELDYVPTQSTTILTQYPTATADSYYQALKKSGILVPPVNYYDKYSLWPIGLPQQNDKIMSVIRTLL